MNAWLNDRTGILLTLLQQKYGAWLELSATATRYGRMIEQAIEPGAGDRPCRVPGSEWEARLAELGLGVTDRRSWISTHGEEPAADTFELLLGTDLDP